MANNTIGEKELKRDWPVVSGIELIDKHEGRSIFLVPQKSSSLRRRLLKGIR